MECPFFLATLFCTSNTGNGLIIYRNDVDLFVSLCEDLEVAGEYLAHDVAHSWVISSNRDQIIGNWPFEKFYEYQKNNSTSFCLHQTKHYRNSQVCFLFAVCACVKFIIINALLRAAGSSLRSQINAQFHVIRPRQYKCQLYSRFVKGRGRRRKEEHGGAQKV